MKQRIQITLDSKVYALIQKSQANKSKYIEDLIVKDFQDTERDSIVEALKRALLEDEDFVISLRGRMSGANSEFAAPEEYA